MHRNSRPSGGIRYCFRSLYECEFAPGVHVCVCARARAHAGRGSVGRCLCVRHGVVGLHPPLLQQRVTGVLDGLDLDLLVVHPHGRQGTGHFLLERATRTGSGLVVSVRPRHD